MTCGAKGKFVGPYISDPWAREQAKKECNGLCSVNGESCVVNFATVECCIVENIPENFPVNI